MSSVPYYQHCLKSELARRCEANPRYSLRAFARSFDIDAGTVSRLLSGRQTPSEKMARRLLSRLELEPQDRARFLSTIGNQHGEKSLRKARKVLARFGDEIRPTELSLEVYRAIAEWYHFAILELTYVEGFRSDPRWIARQLEISVTEAKMAIERLVGLGLLKEEDGRFVKTSASLVSVGRDVTTPAHRKQQRQFLEKALRSLENDPVELRDITNVVMPVDPALLPEARRRIQEFQQSLCKLLAAGDRKGVYNLEICLYPLTRKEEGK